MKYKYEELMQNNQQHDSSASSKSFYSHSVYAISLNRKRIIKPKFHCDTEVIIAIKSFAYI